MSVKTSLIAFSPEQQGISAYLKEIYKIPMLSSDEETELALKYHKDGDVKAAHLLVMSHLKLAAKIAMSYRNYGLSLADMISEANMGLMQAVKKFDPAKGFRFSTYALWWIKASIHEFILKSWSLVKIGTAAVQKRLFYNLNKIKSKLGIFDRSLSSEETAMIASTLNVEKNDVVEMEQRLSGDVSLNARMSEDGTAEKQDFLADDSIDIEGRVIYPPEKSLRNEKLKTALATLNDRERFIISKRYLLDEPETLEDLGEELKISRERVRQIEVKAYRKLETALKEGS